MWYNAKDKERRVHPRPMLGRRHSSTTRKKISEAAIRTFRNGRKVWCKGKLRGNWYQCGICNKSFYLYPYRIREVQGRALCCSRMCAVELRIKNGTMPTGRGIRSWNVCKKRRIYAHSSWEASFLKLCHKAEFVKEVFRPRGWLVYEFGGMERRYYPDFVVLLRSGKLLVVEIKNSAFVNSPQVKSKSQSAREFFTDQYILITEKLTTLKRLKACLEIKECR